MVASDPDPSIIGFRFICRFTAGGVEYTVDRMEPITRRTPDGATASLVFEVQNAKVLSATAQPLRGGAVTSAWGGTDGTN